MDDHDIPIDIHSSKLLGKEWQKKVGEIREKIKHAILDMPESERIVELLKGGYINMFHVVQLIDILKETEADSKNFLGFYSSQRMKDWQEIDSLYKRDSVGLAEAAQLLQRIVQYDIPTARRTIVTADKAIQDGAVKEKDYIRQAADAKKNYEKELSRMGIEGKLLRSELLSLASDLPSFFDEMTSELEKLAPVTQFFSDFQEYLRGDSTPSKIIPFPLLKLIFSRGKAATVYEWRYGKEPSRVEKPSFDLLLKEDQKPAESDEIDFGDDEDEIDFGDGDDLVIDVIADDHGLVAEDGVARGEEALGLFEHAESLALIKAELEKLSAFLSSRMADEKMETSSDIYVSGFEQRPDNVKSMTESVTREWYTAIATVLAALSNPQKRHLFKIRSSPQYVETLVAELMTKKEAEGRFMQMSRLMEDKQKKNQQSLVEARTQLQIMIDSTKLLKKQIESEISKKYNGRTVNLMGGIHQALAPI